MEKRGLDISLFIMGLGSITAQIVLLRELLVSFLGNELTLGIILASWLVLVAAGSFLIGKLVEKVEAKLEVFAAFQLLFSIAFPFTIFLCRIFKNILLTTPGEALGFAPIFYSSLLILLPVTLPYGALFTYGCKLYGEYSRRNAAPIGRVYFIETVGSMIGSLLVTFLLIPNLNPFTIAFSVSLLSSLISIVLLIRKTGFSGRSLPKVLLVASILLSFLFAYCLLPQNSNAIHQSSLRWQWRGLSVIQAENTVYGNITVTRRGEQYTFFTDGVPSITTPVPDIGSIEDLVHFPMLFHEKPESILILNGGAGGMIREILKYLVKRVDYVELDPILLKLLQKFPTSLTQFELSDNRVHIHYTDARLFLQRTEDRFDLIFVGLSAPQSLQTNRFFSSEFFSISKKKMNPNGILVFALPGSLTYISPELRDLNGCMLSTLRNVYRHIKIIPGEVNLYLVSDSNPLESLTSNEISKRFKERNIQASLITSNYIAYRLRETWFQWFSQSMEGKETAINSDFRPLAVFFTLSYWNSLFSPYLIEIFKWFVRSSLALFFVIILIPLILGVLFVKIPRLSIHSLTYSVLATGLTGMFFSLAVIFSFQTLYGFVYHQIGFLIAIFMLGIASGSLLITKCLSRIKNARLLFLKIEIGIIVFSFLFPYLLLAPSHYLESKTIYLLLYGIVLIISFLSGTSLGLQFPLASEIYFNHCRGIGSLGKTASLLYAADLIGGFFGGLFGGILLLPILGLKQSCFIMALVKISSFILFFFFLKPLNQRNL